jgi:hypothetical protein
MLTTKKPAKAFECAQTMTESRNLSARSSKSRKSAPTKPETAPSKSAKTASTRRLPWSPSRSLAGFCSRVIRGFRRRGMRRRRLGRIAKGARRTVGLEPSPSRNANCRIWASVRRPSMAPSSRSSKESTVQIRSVNVCDRLTNIATLPRRQTFQNAHRPMATRTA